MAFSELAAFRQRQQIILPNTVSIGLQKLIARSAGSDTNPSGCIALFGEEPMLLVLDELGYVPFSKQGAELLFQVLAERHERGSVIITTNLGFADWTQVFGEATLTAALLDRLTHRAHIINFNWESYRLKETLKGKKSKKAN